MVILLIVVTVIAFWAIKILGKPSNEQKTGESEVTAQKREVNQATTHSGAIETKAKAQTVVDQQNSYSQELGNELNY